MSKEKLETEILSSIACPKCGDKVWTDNDIEWCDSCDWSRAVAAKPIHYNQHTKGGKQPEVLK